MRSERFSRTTVTFKTRYRFREVDFAQLPSKLALSIKDNVPHFKYIAEDKCKCEMLVCPEC